MSEQWTPTTDQVRSFYAHDSEDEYHDPIAYPSHVRSAEQAFDRWLAEHDREVAAKALIDAAQDIYLPSGGPSTHVDIDYAELLASLYLKGRAEQIKKGAGE